MLVYLDFEGHAGCQTAASGTISLNIQVALDLVEHRMLAMNRFLHVGVRKTVAMVFVLGHFEACLPLLKKTFRHRNRIIT